MNAARVGICFLGSSWGAGVATGAAVWRHDRNDPPIKPSAVANANVVHLLVGLIVAGALVLFRRRVAALAVLPFSSRWWHALGTSMHQITCGMRWLPGVMLRATLFTVMLFCPYRAGMQLFAGLNHNWNLAAWGGPSYLGAALAHWLDATVLFYALAATLARLNRVYPVQTRF